MPLVISDPFTLSLFNVPAGTNDYSVIVSSSGGSTTSSNAVLMATNAVAVAAPANMVAWWQAEGNALDSCGVFNGVTNGNTTYVPGKVGQAFNFDGTSGCVFATNLTSLALGRATNLTIECWIKPAALYGHPIVQFSNGTNAGTLLDIYGYGNSLYADLITTNGANYILGAPWNIVNSNTWQHAALTYDGTNAMIYYNGQPVLTNYLGATNNLLLQTIQYGYGIYLGCQPGGTPVFYAGLMDEVSIYTRALSTNEILGIYNASTAGKSNLPPVVLHPPIGSAVSPGDYKSLSVGAGGSPPLSYQWQLDGANLAGETNATLTIPFFEPNQAGTYNVTITNPWGSTNTNTPLTVYTGSPPDNAGQLWIWGTCNTPQPAGESLTNLAAVAGGYTHTLALQANGTILAWGDNTYGECNVPGALTTNVLAIAAGNGHSLALKMDGTVAAWGNNANNQCNVPSSLTNVIAIAANGFQSMALQSNGLVFAWGATNAPVPGSLSNVTAIAAGDNFCLALLSNGTVTAWGSNELSQTSGAGSLTGVVAIAAGGEHGLALKSDGTVTNWGDTQGGLLNVPATLTNVMGIAAGYYHSLALSNNGTVAAWGTNNFGQTTVPTGLGGVKYIAAGAYASFALEYSPLVQYYLNPANDLLLIYNINSNTTYSSAIMNYYRSNRPMVANANLLAVNCITNETFYPPDYTNIFAAQVQAWLAANPTKRPQYVILFPEIPSRVNWDTRTNIYDDTDCHTANTNEQPSVQYQLATGCAANWTPFVTSINMNGMADCTNYINKLVNIASTYSSGTLLISAGASGVYANTNYYFDDGQYWWPYTNTPGLSAKDSVIQYGASTSAVTYSNIPDLSLGCNITSGTNLAGYLCWGAYSRLGPSYVTNGTVQWTGNSKWYLIETMESYNGGRYFVGQDYFLQWFASNAFGGSSYSNTPVGAVSNVDEPCAIGYPDYFGYWQAGYNFAMCAWNSRNSPEIQAVGDPFVRK